MPSSYQPRQGGVIEVVSEKAMAEIVSDLNKRPASTEYIEPEDKFINEYIQQNSKRIQVVLHLPRSAVFVSNRSMFLFRVLPQL